MSKLTSRGFTSADATAFMERANGPHTLRWKASAYRFVGGVEKLLYDNIPLIGGRLKLDSSNPTRRELTLDVGAAGTLVPVATADPLAPFGQLIKLWCTIDRADGSFFPWLKHGEFPIVTTSSEWPSLAQTVECADYSAVVDAYLHEHKRAYNKLTVRNAVVQITQAALPDKAFAVHADSGSTTTQVESHYVAEAGSSRWDTATELAQHRGYEAFFDWDGDLVIRKDVTADYNESLPGVGPDIGTVSSPVATIRDGVGGNLVAMTVSVSREGAANGVFINLHETVSQTLKDKKGHLVSGDKRVNVLVQALALGTIAWGDTFGRVPVVLERNVKVITDDVVAAQKESARRMLQRRGGVIRVIDLDAVGLYWVEPDDKVKLSYEGIVEAHYIQSIEFDLSGKNATRVKTRALNVSDPG